MLKLHPQIAKTYRGNSRLWAFRVAGEISGIEEANSACLTPDSEAKFRKFWDVCLTYGSVPDHADYAKLLIFEPVETPFLREDMLKRRRYFPDFWETA